MRRAGIITMAALMGVSVSFTGCQDGAEFSSEKLGVAFTGYSDQTVTKDDGSEFVVSSKDLTVSFKRFDMRRGGMMHGPQGPQGMDGREMPRPDGQSGATRQFPDSLMKHRPDSLGGGMPPMKEGRMKRFEAEGVLLGVLQEAGIEADHESLQKNAFEGKNVKGAYFTAADGNSYGVFRAGRDVISFSVKGSDPKGSVLSSISSTVAAQPEQDGRPGPGGKSWDRQPKE